MTLEEARAMQGKRVYYKPDNEFGRILRVNNQYAFVTFDGQSQPQACYPSDLVPESWNTAQKENISIIFDPSDECKHYGCQHSRLVEVVAATLQGRGAVKVFTKALWCEFGQHSFSEKDPDKKAVTITGVGANGEPVTESWTSCGRHGPKTPSNMSLGELAELGLLR